MHVVFGVEPFAISSWSDIRYVLEKFGLNKGVLLANYPKKKWMKLVIDSCDKAGIRPADRLRVVEKLQESKKDRCVSLGLNYNEENDWLENVKQNALDKLETVLTKSDSNDDKFCLLDKATEDTFEGKREKQIKRTASDIADAAKYYLVGEKEIILVDPYFKAKRANTKIIAELLKVANSDNSTLEHIIIHKPVDGADEAFEKQSILNEYSQFNGSGLRISYVRWKSLDFDHHARYLITSKGGLRFDRGFIEPEDKGKREHLTDVVCMESNMVETVRTQFCMVEKSDCFELLEYNNK